MWQSVSTTQGKWAKSAYTGIMGGRYTLRNRWRRFAEDFKRRVTDIPELLTGRCNIAPSQQVLQATASQQ